MSSDPASKEKEQESDSDPCKGCKQVAQTTIHRALALLIILLSIVIMVMVWFTGLVFQVVNFIVAFLILGIGIVSVIMPIQCKPCKCQ